MSFRAVALAALLCFAPCAAVAQETSGAQQSQSEASPEQIAAAREFYRLVTYDGGGVEALRTQANAVLVPMYRTTVSRSPIYQQASPEQRVRLDAVIDTLPTTYFTEARIEMQASSDRMTAQLAPLMSVEEFEGASAFLRSPAMPPLWTQLMQRVVSRQGGGGMLPDWNGTPEGRAFAETPAGRALIRNEETINALFSAESGEMIRRLQPRVDAIFMGQICDALAESCPASLRNSLGRT